jgi:photosystem II stability/assembly factor-like uncharacterized protein
MKPRLYIGTVGLSVWHSDDLGETLTRMLGDTGLYSESRVWALSAHPSRPDELLAGTDSGLYRLDIPSRKWTHVPSGMDKLPIWSIAQSPHDPNLLLAGTRPATIFRSTDGGRTWTDVDPKFPENCQFVLRPRVTKIEFDYEDQNLAWCGLEVGGVYRSRDAGNTWEHASQGMISDDVHDVSVVRNGGRLLYAATNKGLHVSRDNGTSWELQAPFESPSQYTRNIKVNADDSGTMWLCNGDGPPGSWGKLLRSRDHGAHWEDARLPGKLESSAWCVATNRADPKLLFASAALGQYYRSTDGGEHWQALPRRLGETRALVWVPV